MVWFGSNQPIMTLKQIKILKTNTMQDILNFTDHNILKLKTI